MLIYDDKNMFGIDQIFVALTLAIATGVNPFQNFFSLNEDLT
jgi:hypothetical protein